MVPTEIIFKHLYTQLITCLNTDLTIAYRKYRKSIALYKVYHTGKYIALSLNMNPGPKKFNVRQSNESGIEAHRGV